MSSVHGAFARLDEFRPTAPPITGQAYFDLVLIFPAADANSDAVEQADSDAIEKATAELKQKRPSFQGLPGGPKRQRDVVAARARSIGIEAVADLSRDRDEVLLKLSAPDALLEKMAEHLTMEKGLKADRQGREGYYTDFKAAEKERFEPESPTCFFSSLERIRLLQSLLELPQHEGGCGLNLDDLLATKVFTAVVPVHEIEGRRTELMRIWVSPPLKLTVNQPLDRVRDYFGERIAFYYAFTEELTNAVLYPAAMGAVLFIVSQIWYDGSTDNMFTPMYSMFILVWITYFLKRWRRAEARLAAHWHVVDYRETERQRKEFEGDEARGFYSDEGYWVPVPDDDEYAAKAPLTKRFSTTVRRERMVISYVLLTPVLLCMITMITMILSYKSLEMLQFYLLYETDGNPRTLGKDGVQLGSAMMGAINGVYVAVSNQVYQRVARRLTDWENHRTLSDYDDALIVKTMIFQSTNSYAAFFYIAFVKANELDWLSWLTHVPEYCHDKKHFTLTVEQIEAQFEHHQNPYCMNDLSAFMTSALIVNMLTGKILEFVMPWMKAKLREADEEFAMFAAQTAKEETAIERICFKMRVLCGGHSAAVKIAEASGEQVVISAMTVYEAQAKLEPFEGVFSEYSRIVVQLGYVVLFAPAFPLASALLFASFYFELRTDAYKMVCNTRRPAYMGGEDIGSWQTVLRVLAVLGVLTNVGLVGVTDTTLKRIIPFNFLGFIEINESNKLMFLIVVEHLLLLAQFYVVTMIPDMPEDLAVETASQQWRAKAPREPPPPPPAQWDDDALLRIYGTAEKANLAYNEACSKPMMHYGGPGHLGHDGLGHDGLGHDGLGHDHYEEPTRRRASTSKYYDMTEAHRDVDAALRDDSGKKPDLNNDALRDKLRSSWPEEGKEPAAVGPGGVERLDTLGDERDLPTEAPHRLPVVTHRDPSAFSQLSKRLFGGSPETATVPQRPYLI